MVIQGTRCASALSIVATERCVYYECDCMYLYSNNQMSIININTCIQQTLPSIHPSIPMQRNNIPYPFCYLLFVFVRKSFRYFHLIPSRSLYATATPANDLLLYFSFFILSHPMTFRSTRYLFVILLHHRLTDVAKPYDGPERQNRESSGAPKIKRTVKLSTYIHDRLG